jgi:hypothetical protein
MQQGRATMVMQVAIAASADARGAEAKDWLPVKLSYSTDV